MGWSAGGRHTSAGMWIPETFHSRTVSSKEPDSATDNCPITPVATSRTSPVCPDKICMQMPAHERRVQSQGQEGALDRLTTAAALGRPTRRSGGGHRTTVMRVTFKQLTMKIQQALIRVEKGAHRFAGCTGLWRWRCSSCPLGLRQASRGRGAILFPQASGSTGQSTGWPAPSCSEQGGASRSGNKRAAALPCGTHT